MDDLHEEYGGCDLPSLMSSKGQCHLLMNLKQSWPGTQRRQSRTEECLSRDIKAKRLWYMANNRRMQELQESSGINKAGRTCSLIEVVGGELPVPDNMTSM